MVKKQRYKTNTSWRSVNVWILKKMPSKFAPWPWPWPRQVGDPSKPQSSRMPVLSETPEDERSDVLRGYPGIWCIEPFKISNTPKISLKNTYLLKHLLYHLPSLMGIHVWVHHFLSSTFYGPSPQCPSCVPTPEHHRRRRWKKTRRTSKGDGLQHSWRSPKWFLQQPSIHDC